MIEKYPEFTEFSLDLRPLLHPLFQQLPEGVSEFTFANFYLFRETHNYKIAELAEGLFVVTGRDGKAGFFMLPFGLPDESVIGKLFDSFDYMKFTTGAPARQLSEMGYAARKDRDNFDYLYSREELANIAGRKFHKKKNLVNYFT